MLSCEISCFSTDVACAAIVVFVACHFHCYFLLLISSKVRLFLWTHVRGDGKHKCCFDASEKSIWRHLQQLQLATVKRKSLPWFWIKPFAGELHTQENDSANSALECPVNINNRLYQPREQLIYMHLQFKYQKKQRSGIISIANRNN